MKIFTTLLLFFSASPLMAWQEEDAFTFVLELDEQSIQDLRRGQPLTSKIPRDIRGRVSQVVLRFKQPDPNAGASPLNGLAPATALNQGQARLQQPPMLGPYLPNGFQLSDSTNDPNGFHNREPRSNDGSPALLNPDRQGNAAWNGLQPVAPRTQTTDPQNRFDNNQFQPGNYRPNPSVPDSTRPTDQFNDRQRTYPRPQPPNESEFDTVGAPKYRSDTMGPANGAFIDPNTRNLAGNPQQGYPLPDSNAGAERFAANATDTYRWQQPASNLRLEQDQSAQSRPRAERIPGHHVPSPQQMLPPVVQSGYRFGQDSMEGLASRETSSKQFPAASVSGQQPETNSTNEAGSFGRLAGVLWFMLLCSIGLNVYLGMVSRGFYIRYRELADELRETFATSA